MAPLSVTRKTRPASLSVPADLSTLGPTFGVEIVTPDLARTWLGYNTHNRNVNPRTVDGYARDMREGRWMLRGDAIEFSNNPVILLNGQHRLSAVVLADCAVPMLIGRGVDPATQDVTDKGRKRQFSDQLALRGETDAALRAAIIRRGTMWDRTKGAQDSTGSFQPTDGELSEWYARNPEVEAAVQYANHIRRNTGIPGSIAGFAFVIFNRIDPMAAHEFMSRTADGVALPAGSPILALRKRFADLTGITGREGERAKGTRGRIRDIELVALIFMAWNHYREGNSISRLALPKGGLTSKNFPMPR